MANWEDRVWFFDFEVTEYDWLICAKHWKTQRRFYAHNDNLAVINWIREEDPIITGYNIKHYDNYIMKGVLAEYEPARIKSINDFIIKEGKFGWEYDFGEYRFLKVPPSCDLIQDVVGRFSLKEIEGNLCLNIVESTVSFDINRPLNNLELEEMTEYCWHDVDAVEELWNVRYNNYILPKIHVGEKAGLSPEKSLYYTNAQLTALILKAEPVARNDEYDYVYPKTLDLKRIPKEVIEFVEKYKRGEIKVGKDDMEDEEKMSKSKFKLPFNVQGVPHIMGLGGLHGAIPTYFEESDENRVILIADVTSFYPSLIIKYNYLSRNVPDRQLFIDIFNERVEAKAKGIKLIANALKLVINTVFGATIRSTNPLYDPLMGRSICISGQLFLLMLIDMLAEVPTFKLIQSNTDGIMFSVDRAYEDRARAKIADWEAETMFGMECDEIERVVQKDVNNYVMVSSNGDIKTKGGYVSNYPEGSFKNNSYSIVAKAVVEYFVNGTPVEETINNCNDIYQFQLIGKAGRTYDKVIYQ